MSSAPSWPLHAEVNNFAPLFGIPADVADNIED